MRYDPHTTIGKAADVSISPADSHRLSYQNSLLKKLDVHRLLCWKRLMENWMGEKTAEEICLTLPVMSFKKLIRITWQLSWNKLGSCIVLNVLVSTSCIRLAGLKDWCGVAQAPRILKWSRSCLLLSFSQANQPEINWQPWGLPVMFLLICRKSWRKLHQHVSFSCYWLCLHSGSSLTCWTIMTKVQLNLPLFVKLSQNIAEPHCFHGTEYTALWSSSYRLKVST